MTLWAALILGIVEGLTEFLPVSSTGHLTITANLLGLHINDPAVTAFTAVIQVGAILAAVIYFRADIIRLVAAWFRGLFSSEARRDPNYRMAWLVIWGSLPIIVVAFVLRDLITGPLRSLWVVAIGLIAWSFVMIFAERIGKQNRAESELNLKDSLFIGGLQVFSLVPGVSRSGATISAGLIRGLDRVAATRIAFLLGIPALLGAGVFELPDALSSGVGWAPTLLGTVVSFVVAYGTIAWLLRLVAHHSIVGFVWYRWAVGLALILALAFGWISPT
jgi:undecaprenyl-diphosphatase